MRFYVIFTIVFLSMLLVVLAQARRQMGLRRRWMLFVFLAGCGVSFMLVATRITPEVWTLDTARPIWWLGYGFFGLVAYAFLFQTVLYVAERFARAARSKAEPALRSRRAFLAAGVLALSTVAWGVHEGGDVRVLRRRMASPKLKRPVRVVMVSDLHLGALTLTSRVRDLVELVRAQKPDLVLLVGDIVNDHPASLEPFAAMLREMTPELGMYGVFGNHERYEGDARSARVFQWTGATLLRNRVADLPEVGIQLLGVDDPGRGMGAAEAIAREIRGVAQDSDPGRFRILLNHRPEAWREAAKPAGIELMLSGHTHRGQLFPFYMVVRLFNEFMGGFYEEDGMLLAVSAGAGFWGPPMRVGAPPDILVLELNPELQPAPVPEAGK